MVAYFILALCASHVAATKVMFVKGVYGWLEGSDELLEIDIQAKTSRHVLYLNGTWGLSSSVVCGNTWYGAGQRWFSQSHSGTIQMVDISGSAGKLIGIQAMDFFPYQIRCGKQEHELFAVGFDNTVEEKVHLYHISNLDSLVAPTSTIIGTFPIQDFAQETAHGCIFQFTEDSLYAHCAISVNATAAGAEMFKMDLSTGTISTHKQYEGAPGRPIFFVHPSNGKFTGVFGRPTSLPTTTLAPGGPVETIYDYYFCDIDASSTKVSVSQCKVLEYAKSNWYGFSIPSSPAHCNGDDTNYYFASARPTKRLTKDYHLSISAADMNTGDLTDAFQLTDGFNSSYVMHWYGSTLCCSSSSTAQSTVLV